MRRIGIIGAGHVGSHVGSALIAAGACEELFYIDIEEGKARAQADDLQDMVSLIGRQVRVEAGTYSDLTAADVAVICASGPICKEDRLEELGESVRVMDEIIPHLKKSGFAGILLVITNPVDIVTRYLAQELELPWRRVIGSGTTLDTARQVRELSRRTGVAQGSIQGMVLGEHGESQVSCWSQVAVGGVPLARLRETDPAWKALDLPAVGEAARAAGWDILCHKGATEFGIGMAAARIIQAILGDEGRVLPVSVPVGEPEGVFASLPCVLGREGVEKVLRPALDPAEQERFDASCARMEEYWRTIKR